MDETNMSDITESVRERSSTDGVTETKAIGAQVPKEAKHQLHVEATNRSTPDETIRQSDLIREALAEYLDIPLEELEPGR